MTRSLRAAVMSPPLAASTAGAAGTKLRDRNRSVKLRLLEIGRVARAKGPTNFAQGSSLVRP